ncbi:hypothetical protein GTY57_00755, partial [Streptomyces sp. SID5475]|nr:hypothetical protein [Streptomyces sp. SID5475]
MASEPAGAEPGMRVARTRALAVLHVRGTAVAAVLLPAAVAIVLFAAA